MTLSLDANVLIDLVNAHNTVVRAQYDAALVAGDPTVISALVVEEVIFGALISRRTEFQMAAARTILGNHPIADWTEDDAYAAARLRAQLHRAGTPIGSYDTLIAGQALNRGWTLVTANTRQFNRIDGLRIVDWTKD